MRPGPSWSGTRLCALVLASGLKDALAVCKACMVVNSAWYILHWLSLKGGELENMRPLDKQEFHRPDEQLHGGGISTSKDDIKKDQTHLRSFYVPGVPWVQPGQMSARMWSNHLFFCVIICAAKVGAWVEEDQDSNTINYLKHKLMQIMRLLQPQLESIL